MKLSRSEALVIREETLRAIAILHNLMLRSKDWENPIKDDLSKGIGISIGVVDTRILCKLYEYFPDINDLREDKNELD